MHKEMIEFSKRIKARYPGHFISCGVLDVGSLDINGTNKYLFVNCWIQGIDIVEGKNVSIVCLIHKLETIDKFNTIICTEMLEHDKYIYLSLKKMVSLLKPGGLLLITAAHEGRKEHGTHENEPSSSPGTNDYYRNLSIEEFVDNLKPDEFSFFGIEINNDSKDLYFYGIKK